MHEGYYFGSGHYYSDILDFNIGSWWIFQDEKLLKSVIFQMMYILEKTNKKVYENIQSSNNDLLVVYIRKNLLIASISVFGK